MSRTLNLKTYFGRSLEVLRSWPRVRGHASNIILKIYLRLSLIYIVTWRAWTGAGAIGFEEFASTLGAADGVESLLSLVLKLALEGTDVAMEV